MHKKARIENGTKTEGIEQEPNRNAPVHLKLFALCGLFKVLPAKIINKSLFTNFEGCILCIQG